MAPNKSAKNGTANKNHNNNNNNNNYQKNGENGKENLKKKQTQKQIKVKKPKTRDSDCCSINFIKYVLIIVDIVFFMSGTAVIALSVWTLLYKHQYVALLTSSSYQFCTYALLLAGIGAILSSIIGCCGVKRENRAIILIYIILLILVFLFELSAGTVAYIYERNVSDELNMTLSDTVKNNYAIDERVTKAVDLMQQNFKCCGAVRFEEYNESLWIKSTRDDLLVDRDGRVVPDSCCVTVTQLCGRSLHPSNIPYTGCIYKFTDFLREQLIILGSVGLGICVTKLFGIILGCSLYIKLKKLYEHNINQTPAHLMTRDRVSFIYGIDESDDERLPDPPSSINYRNSYMPDFSESNVNRPDSIYDRRN
ncbi:CD151 antigen-like [Chironomus tepperi]|uniref:CD151 antigen-like n=1 Tax=Chironomus tepperi TaxID=113505 RepID=UPI00391FABAF